MHIRIPNFDKVIGNSSIKKKMIFEMPTTPEKSEERLGMPGYQSPLHPHDLFIESLEDKNVSEFNQLSNNDCKTSSGHKISFFKSIKNDKSQSKVLQPIQEQPLIDRDEEFFKLTLLSLQMNHKAFHIVQSIDPQEMFYDAKVVHKLSFHQFPEFIKDELERYYLLKTKNADPDRFQHKEHELEEYEGAKLYLNASEF